VNESVRLRQWIISVGVTLILAFFALSAYDAWRLRQQVERSTMRELSNLARALSEEVERNIQAVDLLLTDTALWYRDHAAHLPPEDIMASLRMRVGATPQVSLLSITDADGKQRYRSRVMGTPLADVSDRPYFIALKASRNLGLYINRPLVLRSEPRSALVAARRLETPTGEFTGVVTAAVVLDDLREVYSAIDMGPGSALLLTFDDGTLVIRAPTDHRTDGRRFPGLTSQQSSAPRVGVSPVDGRDKYIVSMQVAQRPLMMSVTRDVHDAMAPWRAELVGLAGRAIAMALAALLTMWLMLRQLGRIESGERALRHSEQRYAMAMEAANEGHAEWNLEQGTFFASERWLYLHELEPGQMLAPAEGLLKSVPLHPDDLEDARLAWTQHISGCTRDLDLEYRVLRKGGGAQATPPWRWVHARGRCLRDASGKATRFYSAAIDITARKASEDERERLQDELRQALHMQALGTLAGGIAHDFNNVLGAILGHGEMAQKRAGSDATLARHLERVMQAGTRAKLLVRRILEFSRSGVREQGLVNVDRAVEDALQLVVPTLPSNVELHSVLNAGTAAVMGDALQIHQLVSNLCSNAIGAMREGGVLRISVERHELELDRHLSHGALRAGPHVSIRVADQGHGIAPEVYVRMFDPFFSTKAVGEGTGLGLSVVHSIVSDMGGSIDVQTSPQGTEFSVWLPVAGEAEPARAVPGALAQRGQGQVLMVVDDEAPLVEFTEEVLAGLGYEPVGFTSSEQALKVFERDPARFDAVLTDETMPRMSGVQLAARLLALRPDLPVLVMSGYGGEELEQRVRQIGARALVRKPLGATELADVVAAALK